MNQKLEILRYFVSFVASQPMIKIVPILLALTGLGCVFISFRLALHRVHGGKVTVLDNADGLPYSLVTKLGTLRVDRRRKRLRWIGKGGANLLFDFEDLNSVKYEQFGELATLWEILMGFEWWDLFMKYRDYWHTVRISITTHQGISVPIFEAQQFRRRELAPTWLYSTERDILRWLGRTWDVEADSWKAYEATHHLLLSAGVDLRPRGRPSASATGKPIEESAEIMAPTPARPDV